MRSCCGCGPRGNERHPSDGIATAMPERSQPDVFRSGANLTSLCHNSRRVRASAVAEKISLADLHACMPQNVVGGRAMEINVRSGEPRQILKAALELESTVRKLERHGPLGGAFKLERRQPFQEGN